MDLVINVFLQMSYMNLSDFITIFSYILAIVGFVAIVVTPIAMMYALQRVKKYNCLDGSEEETAWSSLTEGLQFKNFWKRNLNTFIVTRKLIYGASLVFMYNYPMSNVFIIVNVNLMITMIIIARPPYKEKWNNVKIILQEILFLAMTGMITLLVQSEFVFSIDARNDIGWVVIVLGSCMILLNVVVMVVAQLEGWKQMWELLKKLAGIRRKEVVAYQMKRKRSKVLKGVSGL